MGPEAAVIRPGATPSFAGVKISDYLHARKLYRTMKRIASILAGLVLAFAAFAQTPAEIISRMEKEMDRHEKDGIILTMDIQMPILGTMSTKVYALGDKTRMEASMLGEKLITWSDGVTEWTYKSDEKVIEITDADDSDSDEQGDVDMLKDITEGYDVSIKKETADSWQIECKKQRTNPNKDDPKKMTLVVAKGTYYPVSLSAKMDGVTMTMKDFSFGVSERDVTFRREDYPGTTVVDKR